MDTNELLKRVRRVEIKTRALSSEALSGEYRSAFKGRGMSFAEVREYQVGDDIRSIDWNVTARTGRPFVKVFEEERELTVILLIDVSLSMSFGLHERTLQELQAEIAATIAFSASRGGDKVGVIFYTDRIEQYIPPSKGRKHILLIIRTLLSLQPKGKASHPGNAIEFLTKVHRRRCVAFVLSDFMASDNYRKPLLIARRRHDITAIRLYDRFMAELPNVGLLKILDAETGHEQYIDTSSKRVRNSHSKWWQEHTAAFNEAMHYAGVNAGSIATDADYVKELIRLFACKAG